MAGIDPMELDLSEFLEEDEQPKAAAPPVDTMTQAIRQELGLEEFGLELPTAAVNGQASMPETNDSGLDFGSELSRLVAAETEVFGAPEPLTATPDPHRHEMSAAVDAIGPSYSPPSTGFGIFEQILMEITRLNLEIQALRITLSSPQTTAGPSVLAGVESAQVIPRRSSPAAATRGGESLTSDSSSRPKRGRGRPRKEETTNDSGELVLME